MTYSKNSLGRSTGRRFNMAAMRREILKTQDANSCFTHNGFSISGKSGQWFVDGWQTIYTSKVKATEAVDRCLSLRAMLSNVN